MMSLGQRELVTVTNRKLAEAATVKHERAASPAVEQEADA
jgi:hypothetical protein